MFLLVNSMLCSGTMFGYLIKLLILILILVFEPYSLHWMLRMSSVYSSWISCWIMEAELPKNENFL